MLSRSLTMPTQIFYEEPVVLQVGGKYKLMKKEDEEQQVVYEDVSFVSYTSAPEMVIVKKDNGQVIRVARYEVLAISKEN